MILYTGSPNRARELFSHPLPPLSKVSKVNNFWKVNRKVFKTRGLSKQ